MVLKTKTKLKKGLPTEEETIRDMEQNASESDFKPPRIKKNKKTQDNPSKQTFAFFM